MYAFDAPLVARFFAIEELRAAGWRHALESLVSASKRTREDAERMWSGATYCPECSAQRRGERGERGERDTPRAVTRERRVS
jgi:hypothetical protein